MKFGVLDNELGGPDVESYSLLSLCLKIYEGTCLKDAVLIDRLSILIKHDVYKVSPEGMAVNKLILDEISKNGMTLGQASSLLYDFVKRHGIDKPGQRLTLIGHGVAGDVKAIFFNKLISPDNWRKLVNILYVDTLSLTTALRALGYFKPDQSLKLGDLCELAGLGPYQFHTADGDVDANWDLIRWIQEKLPFIQLG
jgi:hypothetical protein